jgi:hypothetical protein
MCAWPIYGFLLATGSALAEPTATDKALATQLYDDAEKLVASGEVAVACPKYAESYRLDPQLGVLLHLGDCYKSAGRLASAWSTFREALELATLRNDERQSAIRAQVAELEPNVNHLTIVVPQSAPQAMQIRKNGELVGAPAWGTPMPIDPGVCTISAQAEGYQDWSTQLYIQAAQLANQVTIPNLTPNPVAAPPPVVIPPVVPVTAAAVPAQPPAQAQPPAAVPPPTTALAPPPQPAADTGSKDDRAVPRNIGYGLEVAGLAGVVVGGIFGGMAVAKFVEREKANTCSATSTCTQKDATHINDLTNDARANAKIANIGLIGGAASFIVGLVLVVSNQPPSPKKTGTLTMQPWVGARSAGYALGGSW